MPNHIPPKAPGTLRAPPEKTPQQAQKRANMPLMRAPPTTLVDHLSSFGIKQGKGSLFTAYGLALEEHLQLAARVSTRRPNPTNPTDRPTQNLTLVTMVLGRLGHYALDAVLISTILAGMRRSTGLTVRSDRITGENGEMHKWVNKYLGVGEWVLDQSVAFAGTSKYFERTR
ncbi:hypothetical protein FHL15_007586 [Xylaria flabelliformis]|uniref:DUF1748-domain-containing protein n=1 Tax=Xylaria flabelliformis TaxID=2512241 RepID=A0A553HUG9_9PEZI|nr:hypothetical protein FHL15_007586 [Xylaria flabelliformis]